MPGNATNKGLLWHSSNTSVATVNASSGLIAAVSKGTATITATAKDGSGKSSKCVLTVRYGATLSKDGIFHKVVFSNGTVWRCLDNYPYLKYLSNPGPNESSNPFINEQIGGLEFPGFDTINQRMRCNFWADYDYVNENWPRLTVKEYTVEFLAFLYGIDPFGVITYVQWYCNRFFSIQGGIDYKYQVFRAIFGRDPLYIHYVDGIWQAPSPYKGTDINTYLSESETLFGGHGIVNGENLVVDAIGLVVSAIEVVVAFKFPNEMKGLKLALSVFNYSLEALAIGADAAKGNMASAYQKIGDMAAGTGVSTFTEGLAIEWAGSLVGLYDSVVAVMGDILPVDPNVNKLFEYYSINPAFSLQVQDNGPALDIPEILARAAARQE